jgi:hypothetical protein
MPRRSAAKTGGSSAGIGDGKSAIKIGEGCRTGKLPSLILIALLSLPRSELVSNWLPVGKQRSGNPAGIPRRSAAKTGGGSAGNCDQESAIKISGEQVTRQTVVSEEIQPNTSATPVIIVCPHACNFRVLRPPPREFDESICIAQGDIGVSSLLSADSSQPIVIRPCPKR